MNLLDQIQRYAGKYSLKVINYNDQVIENINYLNNNIEEYIPIQYYVEITDKNKSGEDAIVLQSIPYDRIITAFKLINSFDIIDNDNYSCLIKANFYEDNHLVCEISSY